MKVAAAERGAAAHASSAAPRDANAAAAWRSREGGEGEGGGATKLGSDVESALDGSDDIGETAMRPPGNRCEPDM